MYMLLIFKKLAALDLRPAKFPNFSPISIWYRSRQRLLDKKQPPNPSREKNQDGVQICHTKLEIGRKYSTTLPTSKVFPPNNS